jgi:hypothetical protein
MTATAVRSGRRLATGTAHAVATGARVTARAVAAPVRACARSEACRTAAVGAAVVAGAIACTACAIGAAVGAGVGGGVGLATCHGDAACVARSAVTGAAGGVVAPVGGALVGGGLAGLASGAAGQTMAGHFDAKALARDAAMGVGTAGLLRGVGGLVGRQISKATARTALTNAAAEIEDASSTMSGRNLARQLASEQQMGEAGTRLAGSGADAPLREAPRLAQQYGGTHDDWVKMGSSSYVGPDGFQFETHWYESLSTGERVDFKTKFPDSSNGGYK